MNTEIITPFEIYLVCQLDDIRATLIFVAVAGTILGALASVITFFMLAEHEVTKGMKRASIVILAIGLLSIPIATLTPKSKTVAMMKVIPAIANNEDIQTECKELYNLAKSGLKELVKPEQE